MKTTSFWANKWNISKKHARTKGSLEFTRPRWAALATFTGGINRVKRYPTEQFPKLANSWITNLVKRQMKDATAVEIYWAEATPI